MSLFSPSLLLSFFFFSSFSFCFLSYCVFFFSLFLSPFRSLFFCDSPLFSFFFLLDYPGCPAIIIAFAKSDRRVMCVCVVFFFSLPLLVFFLFQDFLLFFAPISCFFVPLLSYFGARFFFFFFFLFFSLFVVVWTKGSRKRKKKKQTKMAVSF